MKFVLKYASAKMELRSNVFFIAITMFGKKRQIIIVSNKYVFDAEHFSQFNQQSTVKREYLIEFLAC